MKYRVFGVKNTLQPTFNTVKPEKIEKQAMKHNNAAGERVAVDFCD